MNLFRNLQESLVLMAVTGLLLLSPGAIALNGSTAVDTGYYYPNSGAFSQTVNSGSSIILGNYTTTRDINYYMSICSRKCGCAGCWAAWSGRWTPPLGGTILDVYLYANWCNNCCGDCCGRSTQFYKNNESALISGSNAFSGHKWFYGVNATNVRSYSSDYRRGYVRTILCYSLVRETITQYYANGYYTDNRWIDRGAKGYDWGRAWWSASVPSGTTVRVDVRFAQTAAGGSATGWQTVSYYMDNLNDYAAGEYQYLQYRVYMTGNGGIVGSGGVTPTFDWFRVTYYLDNNFVTPTAHYREHWFDTTTHFDASGHTDTRTRHYYEGLALDTATRVQRYRSGLCTRKACNRCACWAAWSARWTPPMGGIILNGYFYANWCNNCCGDCCGRNTSFYKNNESVVISGSCAFSGHKWFNGINATNITAYASDSRRGTSRSILCDADVQETGIATDGYWYSQILGLGTDGIQWGSFSYYEVNTGGGRSVTMAVMGSNDPGMAGNTGWKNIANNENIETKLGATYIYIRLRAYLLNSDFFNPGPRIDWMTVKYAFNRPPTITITNVTFSPAKPAVTGNPANDYLLHSKSTDTPGDTLKVKVAYTITDSENDPCSTVRWEYTADQTMWFGCTASAILRSPADPKAPGSYTLEWNTNIDCDGVWTNLYFRMKANDGWFDSLAYAQSGVFWVDNNDYPVIGGAGTSLQILPDPAYTTDTLTLNTSASATDADTLLNTLHTEDDNNILVFSTSWMVNGVDIPGITQPVLPSSYFIKGDKVKTRVYPYDGKEYGDPVEVEITIQNKPPVITSITLSPATPYTDDDLICTVVATDDDEFIWRETDFRSATVNNMDGGDGRFDAVNCDGNITTTDVDQDNEWELQLK